TWFTALPGGGPKPEKRASFPFPSACWAQLGSSGRDRFVGRKGGQARAARDPGRTARPERQAQGPGVKTGKGSPLELSSTVAGRAPPARPSRLPPPPAPLRLGVLVTWLARRGLRAPGGRGAGRETRRPTDALAAAPGRAAGCSCAAPGGGAGQAARCGAWARRGPRPAAARRPGRGDSGGRGPPWRPPLPPRGP
ncbi:hypothetical protein MC885_008851, partial [Smutsia gigantea]